MKSMALSADTKSGIKPSGGMSIESLALDESSQAIPLHPCGVRPLGNQYAASIIARNYIGYFALWPDEVLSVLLEYLDSDLLLRLGTSCKFLYAFCRSDDLWKAFFIESPASICGSFTWLGTWRATFLNLKESHHSRVNCDTVFSDVLYRPFLCTHTLLTPYATNIPAGNAIPRLDDLTPEQFTHSWVDRPFILTKPVREWPVYKNWSMSYLLDQYGDTKFRAEAVDWTLNTYISYMTNSQDESPLYLFDRSFVTKMNLIADQPRPDKDVLLYWPPHCFGEDLFAVLGNDRPDDKWLIIGPSHSGSTYHKDPNATSAWNAVISGAKYWIMFPSTPSSPSPPGVYVSDDQSEVTSPLSIAEWLLGFHAEARRTPGCIEGVCGEGEVLHVPSGWWHLVVNLEESIAITQNFVPRAHLAGVLEFLKDKPDQVSGFKKNITDAYGLFLGRMKELYPELLEQALAELTKQQEGKKRKWDVAVGAEAEADQAGVFSFGFGDDSDEDVP